MENNLFKLFVYGSLRSGFQHPAFEYISRHFNLVSSAKAKGILYDMGNYPAAVPTEDEAFILGELYELKNPAEFTWAFEQLDDYEGVNPETDEVALYRRDMTKVYFEGKTTTAWVYWYSGNVEGHPIITSGDILEFIQHKSKL